VVVKFKLGTFTACKEVRVNAGTGNSGDIATIC
jgi:hypothetical protein